MGFMDSAKQAAQNLKTQVDGSLAASSATKDAEKHFRDLGLLAYLRATGRPIDQADWDRVVAGLQQLEGSGAIPTFALQTMAPPPPGAAGPPPPGFGSTPPPPQSGPPPGNPPQPGPAAPPPPPPPPPPPGM